MALALQFRNLLLWVCLPFGLLAFTGCTRNLPVSHQNLAYQYDRNFPLQVKFRILDGGEDLQIFARIYFRKLEGMQNHLAVWEKYRLVYRVTPGFESSRILLADTLNPSNRVWPSINPIVLSFRVPKSEKDRLLEMYIRERYSNEKSVFECPLRKSSESGLYSSCLFTSNGRIPVFENYVTAGDTVILRSFDYSERAGSLEFHPFTSSVALPPMAAISTSGHDFTESYPVKVDINKHAVFTQPGYYFLPSSAGKGLGYGFMVTPARYPRVTLPSELIDPMIYISTREERKNLLEASNQKMALDQFWLKVNSNKDQARKLIRSYFENIEDANRLFASHKSGWKTDRGMVYAIYGTPPIVTRTWDFEIWQYDKSMGGDNTVFYFARRPAEKNPDVWELKRYNEYDRVWYGVVELWRKGVLNR